MLRYNKEDIEKLRTEYPEFKINLREEKVTLGEDREELTVSIDGSLAEGLKNPRRIELVKKIKALKYTKESLEDWQKDEEDYRQANEMRESLEEALFKSRVE